MTAPTLRAIRGAIQVDRDSPDVVGAGTRLLLDEVVRRNELAPDDLVSILFTATPDLVSCFPAVAARHVGLHDVPLLCAAEIDVPGALPRVVRMLAHVLTARPRAAVRHVYLGGAGVLRPDLSAMQLAGVHIETLPGDGAGQV
ncbi:chorismate mutase [Micromonospora sp. NPDC050784]|uniref:chorismate mutase n=1 Tax=Micromonospora sp. NPDC050784 TaxID=3364281 RepID=UPI00379BCA7F